MIIKGTQIFFFKTYNTHVERVNILKHFSSEMTIFEILLIDILFTKLLANALQLFILFSSTSKELNI